MEVQTHTLTHTLALIHTLHGSANTHLHSPILTLKHSCVETQTHTKTHQHTLTLLHGSTNTHSPTHTNTLGWKCKHSHILTLTHFCLEVHTHIHTYVHGPNVVGRTTHGRSGEGRGEELATVGVSCTRDDRREPTTKIRGLRPSPFARLLRVTSVGPWVRPRPEPRPRNGEPSTLAEEPSFLVPGTKEDGS